MSPMQANSHQPPAKPEAWKSPQRGEGLVAMPQDSRSLVGLFNFSFLIQAVNVFRFEFP